MKPRAKQLGVERMRLTREPSGYGMVGVSWCSNPFGRTVILAFGKWRLSFHRRGVDMAELLAIGRKASDRLAASPETDEA
jgi:hypothetical protein